NYIRYRPRYPDSLLPLLERELKLTGEHIIADIGCGPGISSEPFLRNGNKVYGIEPNDAMREAAERILGEYSKFRAIKGSAEGALRTFFGPTFTHHRLENQQIFDYCGLEGRLLSSSYVPTADHPNYGPMLRELKRIFERFEAGGAVPFDYDMDVYWGNLT